MKWLVWKDFGVNRLVFITIIAMNILPHLIAMVVGWRSLRDYPAGVFGPTSYYALAALQLMLAVLGGNLIAGERADRSAEFLACMPVSRGRKLASKLLVTLAAIALVWLPNLLVLASIFPVQFVSPPYRGMENEGLILGTLAVTGVTSFCAAWCFSCMLESSAFSAGAGILTPSLIALAFLLSHCHESNPVTPTVILNYNGISFLLSLVGFAVGTRYYLRRVEP